MDVSSSPGSSSSPDSSSSTLVSSPPSNRLLSLSSLPSDHSLTVLRWCRPFNPVSFVLKWWLFLECLSSGLRWSPSFKRSPPVLRWSPRSTRGIHSPLSACRKRIITGVLMFCNFVKMLSLQSTYVATSGIALTFNIEPQVSAWWAAAGMVLYGLGPLIWSPLSRIFGRKPVRPLRSTDDRIDQLADCHFLRYHSLHLIGAHCMGWFFCCRHGWAVGDISSWERPGGPQHEHFIRYLRTGMLSTPYVDAVSLNQDALAAASNNCSIAQSLGTALGALAGTPVIAVASWRSFFAAHGCLFAAMMLLILVGLREKHSRPRLQKLRRLSWAQSGSEC